MARRGRPRRCTSVARLVDKAEKEEEIKAKKLGITKKQQQDQLTSNHIEPATNVVTCSAAGKATIGKSVILTRAARRKAGIPPPTPLFRVGAKHLKTKTSPWQKQPNPSTCSSSTSSSSDEDESVKPLWVQCDHRNCQKWRKLPSGTKIDIKENWYCSMHPDPTYQSCGIPEEKCPRSKKRAFTFSKLSAGQLIWARLKGFPPWPAVVSPDPWSDGDYISEYREGCIYHVEFLGKMRTHSWVPEEEVEPYHCQTLCSLGEIRKSKRLEYALSEADSYTTLSDQERLSKCEYTENAVKVEHLKPQTQAQNSASNLSQKAQVGKPSASTTTNRKGRPSNSSKVTIQASSQPLRDMTNDSSIATNSHAMGALSQISTTGAHEDLFKTLGMGTDERNHINMVANTLIQQIQAQILAALGQSAVATTARIETPKASVQRATASTQRNVTPLDKSTSKSTTTGTHQQPNPGPSSTNAPQKASPTSRLTQTSLELSPDNQVKLVTTKQARRRNVNNRQTSKKQNTKRKRQSPLAQAGGGKKTKAKRSAMEFVSPTIKDYFKTSGSSGRSKTPLIGTPQSIAKDQEVPIVPVGTSATTAAVGNSTFEFQSLEMEAESELAEIQTMLSMFDDIPATTSSGKEKLQNTHICTTTKTGSDAQSSDREQSLKQMVTDEVSSGGHCNGGTVTAGDNMDIESILQEMNTIDDLLQDLSQAQVVPY